MSDRTPKAIQKRLKKGGWQRVKDPQRSKKEKHSKWQHPRLEEYLVLPIGGNRDVSPAMYATVCRLLSLSAQQSYSLE